MISGVISQGAALPRGALASSGAYFDFESIASPKVLGADSQPASSGLHTDTDGFFTARFARALAPAFKASDDAVLAPRVRSAQVLQSALYVAVDVVGLPAVALPGILQTHLHAVDDAIFAPAVLSHGSLRPGVLNAFDVLYAPTLVAAQTLLPNLYTAAETFYAPAVRARLAPALYIDGDAFFVFQTGKLFPGLVTDSETFAAPVVGSPFVTFNTSTNATLSGGNLTATHTTATGSSGARCTTNHVAVGTPGTGKYYFEVTVGATHGASDCIGLLIPSGDYSTIGTAANMTIVYCSVGSAGIWAFSSNTGKNLGGNIVAGDVVGIAVDFYNLVVWFRKNAGNWNGDAAANPATGVNGINLPGTNWGPFVGFNGSGTASGDNFTGNFGATSYANAAPSGFGNW